jgi:hypothetical protein
MSLKSWTVLSIKSVQKKRNTSYTSNQRLEVSLLCVENVVCAESLKKLV